MPAALGPYARGGILEVRPRVKTITLYFEGVINTRVSLAAFDPSGLIGPTVERSVSKARPSVGGVYCIYAVNC